MSKANLKIMRDAIQPLNSEISTICVEGELYCVKDINQITAFISPFIRRKRSDVFFEYDLCLAKVGGSLVFQDFAQAVRSGEFIGLPRTVGAENASELFLKDGVISEWLGYKISRLSP